MSSQEISVMLLEKCRQYSLLTVGHSSAFIESGSFYTILPPYSAVLNVSI